MAAARQPAAKLVDLVTTVESEIIPSPAGPVVWATVDLCYASDGMDPRVSIKVPVPAFETQSDEQRRAEALRRARKLIDHACGAIAPPPQVSQSPQEILAGLAEEIGFLSPRTS